MIRMRLIKATLLLSTTLAVGEIARRGDPSALTDLPNRMPEAAPYVTAETAAAAPPFEDHWQEASNPGQCRNCHKEIFDEWNGSMMSNAWRDPVWRAAFLLLARATSANGDCDTPQPPDGTPKAALNPFAVAGQCASAFDIGERKHTVARPGSLLDGFCSRCHMPTNYVDNVPLRNVTVDAATHLENARVDSNFNPTSDNGTGIAFSELDAQYRNTESGKSGIICAVCHSNVATRDTPFHNYGRSGEEYTAATDPKPRAEVLPAGQQDMFSVPDAAHRNLGYSIGAGAFRLSPHAIALQERFGPLSPNPPPMAADANTSSVFGQKIPYQRHNTAKHAGYYNALLVRSEMCAACHDVTNALPIKNRLGRWVGGFPIERTYTEWSNSRYADRPGNSNFDPNYKRDCQSCHMQQDYGQPGTAQTLYADGHPLPAPMRPVADDGAPHPFFTHHFVGGNALVPRLIGKDVDNGGNVAPYPELSAFSFSSADHHSPYSRAFWTGADRRGVETQQARMAWDRLRHVLSMDLRGPGSVRPGGSAPLRITVANTGSGHNFPTGFPEGRIAWLTVHAYDLATGKELPIHDSLWNRTSVGVGNLTTEELVDPNFPGCNWQIPAGSVDPYAPQFKAVASLGNGCPTLDLPYAAPLNLVTNKQGMPVDEHGRAIDAKTNPTGLPQFRDTNRDGDLFDDSFLRDTRFKPLPLAEAAKKFDRYAVVIPPGTRGPIAVSATVYYQSVEAVVAVKLLGNLADTNENFLLEPCILGGLCDGREPRTEPAVVEGAPAVPMVVRNWVIEVEGAGPNRAAPLMGVYPAAGAGDVYRDVVVKAFFSEPVTGVDARSFTLTDAAGTRVPAAVDQIGDGVWGLFPNSVFLKAGARYTARLKAGVCGSARNCITRDTEWTFTLAREDSSGSGNTLIPSAFATSIKRRNSRPVRF